LPDFFPVTISPGAPKQHEQSIGKVLDFHAVPLRASDSSPVSSSNGPKRNEAGWSHSGMPFPKLEDGSTADSAKLQLSQLASCCGTALFS